MTKSRALTKQSEANPWSTLKPLKRGAVELTIGEAVKFEADKDAEEIARELERRVKEV